MNDLSIINVDKKSSLSWLSMYNLFLKLTLPPLLALSGFAIVRAPMMLSRHDKFGALFWIRIKIACQGAMLGVIGVPFVVPLHSNNCGEQREREGNLYDGSTAQLFFGKQQ